MAAELAVASEVGIKVICVTMWEESLGRILEHIN